MADSVLRNEAKIQEMKGFRCQDNDLFIQDLMSHKEAIELIEWLRLDL
jgi:hypothetical protein